MAIAGLVPTEFNSFIGKNTNDNAVKVGSEWLLSAKNVICQGDDTVKTCPGYTLVQQLTGGGNVVRILEWQRESDKQQFLIVQHGNILGAIRSDGSANEVVLSSSEDPTQSFDLVSNYFAAYVNNGVNAYKLVDNAGVLTKYKWGIDAPLVAPTIASGGGALTLKFGRQYCFSYVSYITDSRGVKTMHIGAPSPLSAHTGPLTSVVVTVGSMAVSADPQVTHKWVFSTVDTPLMTTSTFYFAAEITNATTSFGDTLADSALDTTRLAPFTNLPAPTGSIMCTYQNRAVVIDPISGNTFLSGFEETDLGIPMETFPPTLFFQIPSGVRRPTGVKVVDGGNTLLIGTEEAWYKFTGYNAQTFTEQDKVVGPGPVGKKAICSTPQYLVWMSRDKRLWAWNTSVSALTGVPGFPMEFSFNVQQKLIGLTGPFTYSMEDMKDSQLSNAELLWFTYGKHHYVVCSCNTNDAVDVNGAPVTSFNWIQLWYVDYENGTIKSVGETDKIPNDRFMSSAVVLVNASTSYIFFGDSLTGNIYRWPDGFRDNGASYIPTFSSAWSQCEFEGNKRMYWIDVVTDRGDFKDTGHVLAAVAAAPDLVNMQPIGCDLQAMPAPEGNASNVVRANMQQQGTSIGNYVRWQIVLPDDGVQTTVRSVKVFSKPVYQGAP